MANTKNFKPLDALKPVINVVNKAGAIVGGGMVAGIAGAIKRTPLTRKGTTSQGRYRKAPFNSCFAKKRGQHYKGAGRLSQ